MKRSQYKVTSSRIRVRDVLIVLLAGCLLSSFGCQTVKKTFDRKPDPGKSKSERIKELQVGYDLLETTLAGEAKLKWLLLFRKVTLKEPGERVKNMLETIQKGAANRVEELTALRKLSPDVSGKPAPSAIGDAIQGAATDEGTKEMVFSDGSFSIRFVFLQAQATRMISVIARQTALIDTNPRRQKWLMAVSKQFEDYRESLVRAFERCQPR